MSNSSLSENISINNDPDTPSNPLTPPPSPLSSPNEEPIGRTESPESQSTQHGLEKPTTDEDIVDNEIEHKTDTQFESQDGDEKVSKLNQFDFFFPKYKS